MHNKMRHYQTRGTPFLPAIFQIKLG